MTILLICNRFPPLVDGVGDYTFHLANALQQSGDSVHVICRKQESVSKSTGLEILPIIEKWNRATMRILLPEIKRIKPDWIGLQHVPTGFQKQGLPVYLPGIIRQIKKSGYRVFTMFHEVKVRRHNLRSCIISTIQYRIAQGLCRHSEQTITSIELYARLLGPHADRTAIIPVGSNVIFPNEGNPENSVIRKNLASADDLLLCTFGDRDLRNLVLAVQKLRAEFPKLRLLICGKNRSNIDEQRFPFVRNTGYRTGDEIREIFQSADIFILPDPVSAQGHGGSSNKSGSLAAACAAGLPILGIKGNLNNSLLQHGKNILLAEGNCPDELAKNLRILILDKSLRKRLGRASRDLYEKHLTWPLIVDKFRKVLRVELTSDPTQ